MKEPNRLMHMTKTFSLKCWVEDSPIDLTTLFRSPTYKAMSASLWALCRYSRLWTVVVRVVKDSFSSYDFVA